MVIGIIICAIFLLLASASIYLVVQGFTRPLANLMRGVKTLEQGQFSLRIPVESEDEIGEVTQAFNTMIETLGKRENEKNGVEEQLRRIRELEAKQEWERTFDAVPDLIAILDREQSILKIGRGHV